MSDAKISATSSATSSAVRETVVMSADNAGGQSAAGLSAMRTPAYLVLSALGVAIAALAWAPWHGVAPVGEPALGLVDTVAGVEAGGWGTAAIVGGVALALLGVLGYFWNPFSDPEALFIALISALVLAGAIYRIFDVRSWSFEPEGFDGTYQVGAGLWLLAVAAGLSLVGALLIAATRGRADK